MTDSQKKELDSSQLGTSAKKLLKFLKTRIKGQDNAIESLVRAIDFWESGLHDSRKTIHSALLVGPSGSGKTLLARTLAEYWFNSPDAVIEMSCCRFDDAYLSQKYIGSHHFKYLHDTDPNLKKLIEEYNNLVEKISALENKKNIPQRPGGVNKQIKKLHNKLQSVRSKIEKVETNLRSIIVLDHIECANLDMQDFISEILENGKIILSNGQSIYLNNSAIFVTSNDFVAEKDPSKELEIDGFRGNASSKSDTWEQKEKKIYLKNWEGVKSYFSPRFLGCLDRTYIFRELDGKVLLEILELMLDKFCRELHDRFSITLEVDEEVRDFIVLEGSDEPSLGARLLGSKFDKYIRKPIGRLKNCKSIKKGGNLIAGLSGGKVREVVFRKQKPPL